MSDHNHGIFCPFTRFAPLNTSGASLVRKKLRREAEVPLPATEYWFSEAQTTGVHLTNEASKGRGGGRIIPGLNAFGARLKSHFND